MIGPGVYARALGSVRTAMEIQERINEYTMFQSTLIRRHAQVFEGATNKIADIFAVAVSVVAVAILLPGVLLIGVLLAQRNPELASAYWATRSWG